MIRCTWGLGPREDDGVTQLKQGPRCCQGCHRLCPGSWATPSHGCDVPQMSPHASAMLLRLPQALHQRVLAGACDGAGVAGEIKHKLPVLFVPFPNPSWSGSRELASTSSHAGCQQPLCSLEIPGLPPAPGHPALPAEGSGCVSHSPFLWTPSGWDVPAWDTAPGCVTVVTLPMGCGCTGAAVRPCQGLCPAASRLDPAQGFLPSLLARIPWDS